MPCEVRVRELVLFLLLTTFLLDRGDRATVRNPTPAQSPARGTSSLPCPFSGPNSVRSGSTSLSFQGPPGRCHLICCLLARCWQQPGPLPHPEQEEQHLLLLDCCLVLPPDLYICVFVCVWLQGVGPMAWLLVRCVVSCFAGRRGAPIPVCSEDVGLASIPSAALCPALFAFGSLVPVGLKDPALRQMLFPPVSNPLKASISVGLGGFEGSVSPFFGESQRCFWQTPCLVLSSGLCTRIPITAGRPCQSHGTEMESASSFFPPNHFLAWDSHLSLTTGILPAQLHRAVREKPVPGSQHLNPLGYPYQTVTGASGAAEAP